MAKDGLERKPARLLFPGGMLLFQWLYTLSRKHVKFNKQIILYQVQTIPRKGLWHWPNKSDVMVNSALTLTVNAQEKRYKKFVLPILDDLWQSTVHVHIDVSILHLPFVESICTVHTHVLSLSQCTYFINGCCASWNTRSKGAATLKGQTFQTKQSNNQLIVSF